MAWFAIFQVSKDGAWLSMKLLYKWNSNESATDCERCLTIIDWYVSLHPIGSWNSSTPHHHQTRCFWVITWYNCITMYIYLYLLLCIYIYTYIHNIYIYIYIQQYIYIYIQYIYIYIYDMYTMCIYSPRWPRPVSHFSAFCLARNHSPGCRSSTREVSLRSWRWQII